MVFERNLNGIEVILRIDNYESPSKHTFGDWWCDCGFSFRMGKLAEIINYRKDHDELLTPEEVDGLADALTNLLEGKSTSCRNTRWWSLTLYSFSIQSKICVLIPNILMSLLVMSFRISM